MREISFRAYLTLSGYDPEGIDKDYHAMATNISVHSDGSIGFNMEHGHEIFEGDVFEQGVENGIVSEYEGWCLWEGPFELMQYTGLKDKNGVKIFEGDIVDTFVRRNDRPGDHYKNGNVSKVIEWVSENHRNGWNLRGGEHTQYEVIGNIYENPELLK